jgi:hypothetical protein
MGECRFRFFKGFGNNFSGRFRTLDRRKRFIRINQLSETKLIAGVSVNKSIIAGFKWYGFYRLLRKFS